MSSVREKIPTNIRFVAILGGLLLCETGYAQSRLPACPDSEDVRWHNCQGVFIWSNGEKYVGEFRDDKRNGQGVFTWPNGEKYVGEFRDNKRNGSGTRYSTDGSVLEQGLWKDGELLREAVVTTPAPRANPVAVEPPKPTLAPAVKGIQQSDPNKKCNEQAEAARADYLRQGSTFSSKALAHYDPRSQNCYALITIMPRGQFPIMIIESLLDLGANMPLAKIEHQAGANSVGLISDQKYKGSSTPTVSAVQSYIDEKMAGKR